MHNFYVISYDIRNDKTRNNVAKTLEDYGTRIQYSVFEFIMDETKLEELLQRLKKIIDIKEDSVRIYTICNACLKKTKIVGEGELTKDIDIYII